MHDDPDPRQRERPCSGRTCPSCSRRASAEGSLQSGRVRGARRTQKATSCVSPSVWEQAPPGTADSWSLRAGREGMRGDG